MSRRFYVHPPPQIHIVHQPVHYVYQPVEEIVIIPSPPVQQPSTKIVKLNGIREFYVRCDLYGRCNPKTQVAHCSISCRYIQGYTFQKYSAEEIGEIMDLHNKSKSESFCKSCCRTF